MRRILKSRRAISGAVTALILVIVSVALALAVAVFAFGLFGSFGSSGQIQAIGTPQVSWVPSGSSTGSSSSYYIYVNVTIKNSGSNPATIQSITVGNITATAGSNILTVTPTTIPGGYDGVVSIKITYSGILPGSLSKANLGGSVPITMTLSEGSLSPTLTLQGIFTNSTTS